MLTFSLVGVICSNNQFGNSVPSENVGTTIIVAWRTIQSIRQLMRHSKQRIGWSIWIVKLVEVQLCVVDNKNECCVGLIDWDLLEIHLVWMIEEDWDEANNEDTLMYVSAFNIFGCVRFSEFSRCCYEYNCKFSKCM